MMNSDRLVAVPDTDGELAHALAVLEEVLLQLQPYEADEPPAPLGLGAEVLDALERIQGTISAAERSAGPVLMAAGGTFELVGVRFVHLDDTDLATVGEAIAALGLGLVRDGDEVIADVLGEFVEGPGTPGALVASFAQAHGLIDLAADQDTRSRPTTARWCSASRRSGPTGRDHRSLPRLDH